MYRLTIITLIILTPIFSERNQMADDNSPLFFSDGREAVKVISELLRKQNWGELSRYYDLSGTSFKREDLISGEFFYHKIAPQVGHPAGFNRYKHPFSPGFSYDGEYTLEPNITVVRLKVEIDQGGGMVQTGYDSFGMRSSASGYQVIPGAFPVFPELH